MIPYTEGKLFVLGTNLFVASRIFVEESQSKNEFLASFVTE